MLSLLNLESSELVQHKLCTIDFYLYGNLYVKHFHHVTRACFNHSTKKTQH